MGSISNDRVVNGVGQVFKVNNDSMYDELYVVDSSIIPALLGVILPYDICDSIQNSRKIVGYKKYWPYIKFGFDL